MSSNCNVFMIFGHLFMIFGIFINNSATYRRWKTNKQLGQNFEIFRPSDSFKNQFGSYFRHSVGFVWKNYGDTIFHVVFGPRMAVLWPSAIFSVVSKGNLPWPGVHGPDVLCPEHMHLSHPCICHIYNSSTCIGIRWSRAGGAKGVRGAVPPPRKVA